MSQLVQKPPRKEHERYVPNDAVHKLDETAKKTTATDFGEEPNQIEPDEPDADAMKQDSCLESKKLVRSEDSSNIFNHVLREMGLDHVQIG